MNFSMKLVMCVAFLCVASFAQQSNQKNAPLAPQDSIQNSQKNTKGSVGVIKQQASTWTKIKDMFQ